MSGGRCTFAVRKQNNFRTWDRIESKLSEDLFNYQTQIEIEFGQNRSSHSGDMVIFVRSSRNVEKYHFSYGNCLNGLIVKIAYKIIWNDCLCKIADVSGSMPYKSTNEVQVQFFFFNFEYEWLPMWWQQFHLVVHTFFSLYTEWRIDRSKKNRRNINLFWLNVHRL